MCILCNKRWEVDQSGCCPVLQSRINVDWFTFDPQMFTSSLNFMTEFYMMCDVFIQKAAGRDSAPNSLAPWKADQWLHKVRAMWPLQMTSQLPNEIFMLRERRRLHAFHDSGKYHIPLIKLFLPWQRFP